LTVSAPLVATKSTNTLWPDVTCSVAWLTLDTAKPEWVVSEPTGCAAAADCRFVVSLLLLVGSASDLPA
jgi:hypothetical protein